MRVTPCLDENSSKRTLAAHAREHGASRTKVPQRKTNARGNVVPAMPRANKVFSQRLHTIITERRIPGAGFVIFGLDRPTQIGVAGRRRSSDPSQVGIHDRWHVGSISKSMTAALMLRLHERGALDLCESVMSALAGTEADRFADARHFGSVTIADLLSHRSGIRSNPSHVLISRYVLLGESKESTDHAALRQSLTRGIGPAREYRYSNSGYGIAGLIAAHRTASTWQDLIRSHVADAVGLPSVGFGRPEWYGDNPWGHRPTLVRRGFTEFKVTKRGLDLDAMRPAGDVFLSLADLATYGTAHLSLMAGEASAWLSTASAARMYRPVGGVVDPHRGGSYALGWHVEDAAPDFDGQRLVWHNGSDLFSFAMLGLLPESRMGFALVTNALQRGWHEDHSLVWEPVAELARFT
jgi:CubicO group peptidase (beta-lactamase class C family)